METFSALLALCEGNSPVTGEFPSQRPVTQSFDVFFDLRLNKRLSKQSWGWWFETPSRLLWRHCNDILEYRFALISSGPGVYIHWINYFPILDCSRRWHVRHSVLKVSRDAQVFSRAHWPWRRPWIMRLAAAMSSQSECGYVDNGSYWNGKIVTPTAFISSEVAEGYIYSRTITLHW